MPNARALHVAEDLALPLDAVTEVLAFVGRRGQGKSYAAQLLAEQMHAAEAQFVVLDPVGVWWGLRLAANGKDPGIPIPVLGGLHGDVPLEPTAGKLVADLVVDRGISAVLDVSQFESDAAKARFAAEWGARFFYRKKAAPSAVHVFVEEAQEFVPQNPQRDEAVMLHHFQRLAKLGRNFGVGLSLITQRPQEVHKKVLNLTELLFAFQLTGTHERRAVADWIEDKSIDEDVAAELPKLQRWHPHAWSPAWLGISRVVAIAERWTFDASSTPKVGKRAQARALGAIDLAQLERDMAATIERAQAEDPKALRARIAELERSVRQASREAPDPAALQAEYSRGRDDAMRDFRALMGGHAPKLRDAAEQLQDRAQRAVEWMRHVADAIAGDAPAHVAAAPSAPLRAASVPVKRLTAAPASSKAPPRAASGNGVHLSGTQQRILNALALFAELGQSPTTRAAVAGVCGISHTTGSFSNNLSALRTAGLIEDAGDARLVLTPDGRAHMTALPAIASVEDVHALWLASMSLSGTQKRMVAQLLRAYPRPITRQQIADALGVQADTGSFSNNLSKLRTLGLLADVSRSEVIATELLFPGGLG